MNSTTNDRYSHSFPGALRGARKKTKSKKTGEKGIMTMTENMLTVRRQTRTIETALHRIHDVAESEYRAHHPSAPKRMLGESNETQLSNILCDIEEYLHEGQLQQWGDAVHDYCADTPSDVRLEQLYRSLWESAMQTFIRHYVADVIRDAVKDARIDRILVAAVR